LREYRKFTERHRVQEPFRFRTTLTEEEAIEAIKRITGKPYIDSAMLTEIASMQDFAVYFSHRIQAFHRMGLSRNIRSYRDYQRAYLAPLGCGGI
jgi:hypothetical protein